MYLALLGEGGPCAVRLFRIGNNTHMDSLQLIETFREVARRGSFSATARAQGVSPATVSKAIAQLERRFGLRLLQRTTRKVSLTDAGRLLFERSGALLELIDLTQGELHERATRPSGRLSLTAPHSLMQTDLPLELARFMAEFPDVRVDLHVTDRVVNLAEEGVDLAFRAGRIPDAYIVVRRLSRIQFVAAATPAYWAGHGVPQHPQDLGEHRQLAFGVPGQAPYWNFEVDGKLFALPLNPVFHASSWVALAKLAVQGLGVVWMPARMLGEPIADGRLQAALQEYTPSDFWLYAAYMERRQNSAALRALLDHLDEFSRVLDRDQNLIASDDATP